MAESLRPGASSAVQAVTVVPALRLVCPHCVVGLPPAWPRGCAGRCPTCHLLIGVDRAVAADGREQGGSAAGLLANAARRADVQRGDPDAVLDALHAAASDAGVSVARLRMLDYGDFRRGRPEVPTLAVVLATFTTWKRARARAAIGRAERIVDDAHPTRSVEKRRAFG